MRLQHCVSPHEALHHAAVFEVLEILLGDELFYFVELGQDAFLELAPDVVDFDHVAVAEKLAVHVI